MSQQNILLSDFEEKALTSHIPARVIPAKIISPAIIFRKPPDNSRLVTDASTQFDKDDEIWINFGRNEELGYNVGMKLVIREVVEKTIYFVPIFNNDTSNYVSIETPVETMQRFIRESKVFLVKPWIPPSLSSYTGGGITSKKKLQTSKKTLKGGAKRSSRKTSRKTSKKTSKKTLKGGAKRSSIKTSRKTSKKTSKKTLKK